MEKGFDGQEEEWKKEVVSGQSTEASSSKSKLRKYLLKTGRSPTSNLWPKHGSWGQRNGSLISLDRNGLVVAEEANEKIFSFDVT